MVPHSDPVVSEVDDKVFMNINKSCLHFVVARAHVFPCSEAIERIIYHTNLKSSMIVCEKGECIGSF